MMSEILGNESINQIYVSPQDIILPEQSIKLLDFEIDPEEITPNDVFTLAGEKGGLPQEISDEQRTYLSRLMGVPGAWISQDHPMYQIMDGFLSATFAHYLSIPKLLGGSLELLIEQVFHKEMNFKVGSDLDKFLQEQLQNYNPDFHHKINRDAKKHQLAGIAVKMIYKKVKTGDLLGAYEAFWGSWNPIWRHPNRMFYKGAGGDKRPFFASVATMGYNGFMHVFHPVCLPMYIATGIAANQPLESFLLTTGFNIAKGFVVLGIPIGLRKYLRNRRANTIESDVPNRSIKSNLMKLLLGR